MMSEPERILKESGVPEMADHSWMKRKSPELTEETTSQSSSDRSRKDDNLKNRGKGKAKATDSSRKRVKKVRDEEESNDEFVLGEISADEVADLSSNLIIPRSRRKSSIRAQRLNTIEIQGKHGSFIDDDDDDDDEAFSIPNPSITAIATASEEEAEF